MNFLIDNNVIIDYYDEIRRKKYPESIKLIDNKPDNCDYFVSSSSLDNLAFMKKPEI